MRIGELIALTVLGCALVNSPWCGLCAEETVSYDGSENKSTNTSETAPPVDHEKLIYERLLKTKRKEQKEIANSLMAMEDFGKQYKVVHKLSKKIIEVLTSANTTLNASSYEPGISLFPNKTEEHLRDAIANVVENTMFFGDLALRLPDIFDEMFKVLKWKSIKSLVGWGWDFTNRTGFISGSDLKLMHLMAQELRLIERESDYQNPYRRPKLTPAEWEKARQEKAKMEKKLARLKKKKARRKPQLSGGHTEL